MPFHAYADLMLLQDADEVPVVNCEPRSVLMISGGAGYAISSFSTSTQKLAVMLLEIHELNARYR
jgi:hypothetical protein